MFRVIVVIRARFFLTCFPLLRAFHPIALQGFGHTLHTFHSSGSVHSAGFSGGAPSFQHSQESSPLRKSAQYGLLALQQTDTYRSESQRQLSHVFSLMLPDPPSFWDNPLALLRNTDICLIPRALRHSALFRAKCNVIAIQSVNIFRGQSDHAPVHLLRTLFLRIDKWKSSFM